MSEQFNQNASSQGESDVVALIKKIQEQLVVLEKKIDSLINKPSERPAFRENREKRFSKPFRTFSPANRHGGAAERGRGPREGGFPRHARGDRDGNSRSGGFSAGQTFGKHPSTENRGFGAKKKPFYNKNKDRGQAAR